MHANAVGRVAGASGQGSEAMGRVSRWVVTVSCSVACFGGSWAGFAAERLLDTGARVGVASALLAVVLAVLGAWAESSQGIDRRQRAGGPAVAEPTRAPPRAVKRPPTKASVTAGPPSRIFSGHSLGLPGVAFSPDGALLATVSDDKVARLWNVGSGQTTRTFIGHSEGLRGVAFSPDGALLATCFRRRDKGSVPGWPGGE
jgi:hypothetical protein